MSGTVERRPMVGVGVIIRRGGKVLLGRRRNSHGEDSWSFPGGHLEFGESVEQCAAREALEETGLTICRLRSGPYTNDIFHKEGKHYITLYILADCEAGEASLLEPEKCSEWRWFSRDELPAPLFLPLRNLIATHLDSAIFEEPPAQPIHSRAALARSQEASVSAGRSPR